MKSVMNVKKIKRRALFANGLSVGGLLMLVGSVVLPLINEVNAPLASLLMIAGLGISMIGIYFANRWVKRPRPEVSLDQALKSLSDSHILFHYPSLPVDHILLAPYGVVILETVNLEGRFTYINGRWKEQITLGRAMRYVVEEHLGDPIVAAQDLAKYLSQKLAAAFPGGEAVPVTALVVFIHPNARLEVTGAPIPVCMLDKLRRSLPSKSARISPETYQSARQFFDSRYR